MFAQRHRWASCFVAAVATLACTPARPVHPLRPAYPSILASVGYAGTVRIAVKVPRSGHASVIWHDPMPSDARALFSQSIRQAVQAAEWRVARRWGRVRTDTVGYDIVFVLRRDTLPLAENEKYFPGNETLPLVCPPARTARQVVVCAVPERVRYSVLY